MRDQRASRLFGQIGDLGDSVLISRGAGNQVKVLVVQTCHFHGILPVPLCGIGGLSLHGIAFQRAYPGSDGVLSQCERTPLGRQHRGGHRARSGDRGAGGILGPQLRDIAQGRSDLPFVPPQYALRHGITQVGCVYPGYEDAGYRALSAVQELTAWQVQGDGTNDFVSVKNLAHRREPASRSRCLALADHPLTHVRREARVDHGRDVPGIVAIHQPEGPGPLPWPTPCRREEAWVLVTQALPRRAALGSALHVGSGGATQGAGSTSG